MFAVGKDDVGNQFLFGGEMKNGTMELTKIPLGADLQVINYKGSLKNGTIFG